MGVIRDRHALRARGPDLAQRSEAEGRAIDASTQWTWNGDPMDQSTAVERLGLLDESPSSRPSDRDPPGADDP